PREGGHPSRRARAGAAAPRVPPGRRLRLPRPRHAQSSPPRDGADRRRGARRRPVPPPERPRPRPLLDPRRGHGGGAEHDLPVLALEHLSRLRDWRADPARHRRRQDPLAHEQPAAAGEPARLRPRDRRVGTAVGRRRVRATPRRRPAPGAGAAAPLRSRPMRRSLVAGVAATLVVLALQAHGADDVVTATLTADAAPLRARLRYQACNDSRCLPPRMLELVARDERGATNEGRGAATVAGGRVSDWIEQSGYALTFLWVAFLGLALNLTPCVYPLISVTIAFFGGSTGAVGRPVVRPVAYVLGICLTFSAL